MTAGTVSSNTAATSGGGVNLESGSFAMSGGTISGNKVTGSGVSTGGGVNVCSGGTFNMSGSAVIDAETDGANDVYLINNETITIAGTLTPENTTLSNGNNATKSARITPVRRY